MGLIISIAGKGGRQTHKQLVNVDQLWHDTGQTQHEKQCKQTGGCSETAVNAITHIKTRCVFSHSLTSVRDALSLTLVISFGRVL